MANNDPCGGGYQGYAGQSYAGYCSDINSIRNRLAMAQLQAGMSSDPIRSKWQGVARLSDALFGSLALQRASEQGAAGATAFQALISIIYVLLSTNQTSVSICRLRRDGSWR
jgi:hypothetical protein